MNLRNKGESPTQAVKVEWLSDRNVQNIAGSHIYFRRKERKNAKHLLIVDLGKFSAYKLSAWILRPNLPATIGVRSDSVARVRPA